MTNNRSATQNENKEILLIFSARALERKSEGNKKKTYLDILISQTLKRRNDLKE